MTKVPERAEAAPYYFTYIDQVPAGNIVDLMAAQSPETSRFFRAVPAARSLERYAPGKWSLRDVVAHCADAERVFQARAFWFARGFDSPLPSFEQDLAAASARADERDWGELVDELDSVRAASLSFFRSLGVDDWDRRGIASGNPFTVRAIAYITVGHVAHHVRIARERYLTPRA